MSGRKLGGGRILGSGKGLAPPAPPAHQRMGSLVSLSESVVSESSRDGTASPLGTNPLILQDASQDLVSRATLQNGGANTVTAANSKLVCPICNEEMVCFPCVRFCIFTEYRR